MANPGLCAELSVSTEPIDFTLAVVEVDHYKMFSRGGKYNSRLDTKTNLQQVKYYWDTFEHWSPSKKHNKLSTIATECMYRC